MTTTIRGQTIYASEVKPGDYLIRGHNLKSFKVKKVAALEGKNFYGPNQESRISISGDNEGSMYMATALVTVCR